MHGRIVLGKIDYGDHGRKVNEVDIEYELTPEGCFTASGSVWNARHTDILSGGQMLEEIGELFPADDRVRRVLAVWRNWHLNHLKAGTPRQEAALKKHFGRKSGSAYDTYDDKVNYLKSVGLYEDDGYKYGTKWNKDELPDSVKREIESWDDFEQGAPSRPSSVRYGVTAKAKSNRKSSKKSDPGVGTWSVKPSAWDNV